MLHASLKDFLATGRIGPIEPGVREEQVERILGTPDAKGGTSRTQRRPSIWKYGSIELHFDARSRVLSLIHADHFDTLRGGGDLDLDPWVLSGALHRSAAEQALQQAGISYQLRPSPHEPDSDEIRTCGDVCLLFCGEGDAAQRRLTAFWRRDGRL